MLQPNVSVPVKWLSSRWSFRNPGFLGLWLHHLQHMIVIRSTQPGAGERWWGRHILFMTTSIWKRQMYVTSDVSLVSNGHGVLHEGDFFRATTCHYGRAVHIFSVFLAICAIALDLSKQMHKCPSLIRILYVGQVWFQSCMGYFSILCMGKFGYK